MKRFFSRVKALMAKDGKALSRSLPSILLLLVLLCAGCVFLCMSIISELQKDADKMAIGIVDKDGSMVSKLAIGMVTGNDEVAALFEVVEFDDANAAYDAVVEGQTVAALVFEENYFDKVLDGEDAAISVVLSREMELHSQLVRDFAGTGEILIKTGEYGVDAAWYPVMDAFDDRDTALVRFDAFTVKFAVELLSITGKSVDGVVLPYSDRAGSVEGHYMLHYTVLLLTLLDMLFFDFVRREGSRTLLCRLKSAGVGSEHIMAAKLPFLLATKGILLAAVLVVLGLIFGLTVTPVTVLAALAGLLFSGVCGVGLCVLLQRSNVGPCILCALGFAGLFLCGGLVPYDMLPESVTFWGQFTPLGITASLMSGVFGGQMTLLPFALALIVAALLLVGGWFYLEQLRVKGSEQV